MIRTDRSLLTDFLVLIGLIPINRPLANEQDRSVGYHGLELRTHEEEEEDKKAVRLLIGPVANE